MLSRPASRLVSVLALLLTGVIAMSLYASHASAATAGSIAWSGPTRLGTFAQPAAVDLAVTTPDSNPAQRYRVRLAYTYVYPPGTVSVEEPRIYTEQAVASSWQPVTANPQLLYPASGLAAGTTTTIRLRMRSFASSASLVNGADRVTATVTADLVPVDANGTPNGSPVATADRVFNLVPLRLANSWPSTMRLGEPTPITYTYINDSDTTFVPASPDASGPSSHYRAGSAVQTVSIVGNRRCDVVIAPSTLPVVRMPPHASKSFRLTVTMQPRITCDHYETFHAWHPSGIHHGLLLLGFSNGFDFEVAQAYYNVPVTILPERVVAARPVEPMLPATGRPVRAEFLIGAGTLVVGVLLQLMSVGTRRPEGGKR